MRDAASIEAQGGFEAMSENAEKKAETQEKLPPGAIMIDIELLRKGMICAKDVMNAYGTPIIRKGRELEGKHILQMRMSNISEVCVFGEQEKKETASDSEFVHVSHYPGHEAKLAAATVLIVDDSKAARMLIRELLEDAGLKVVGAAKDVPEAIERTKTLNPTCVTLDISMPGEEGTAAIAPMLSHNPKIKIVMVSSLGYKDRIMESLRLGASKFITKPFDHEDFKRVIISAIIE